MKAGSRAAIVAGQGAVTLGLGWLILRQVRLDALAAEVRTANVPLLALAYLLLVGRLPLAAYRWGRLLDRHGHGFGLAYLTRVVVGAQFLATVMPGGSGADLARGYAVSRREVLPRHVVGTVLADRVAGLLGLVLLAVPPALWLLWRQPGLWPASVPVLGLLAGAAGAAWLLPRWRSGRAADAQRRGWAARLARLGDDLAAVAGDRALVAQLVAVSMLFHLIGVLAVYLVGRAVGAGTGLQYYLLFVPLVWLGVALPISINGIGVREGGFLFYFGLVGMPREQALAMSLLVFAGSLLQGLVGGIVLLVGGDLDDGGDRAAAPD